VLGNGFSRGFVFSRDSALRNSHTGFPAREGRCARRSWRREGVTRRSSGVHRLGWYPGRLGCCAGSAGVQWQRSCPTSGPTPREGLCASRQLPRGCSRGRRGDALDALQSPASSRALPPVPTGVAEGAAGGAGTVLSICGHGAKPSLRYLKKGVGMGGSFHDLRKHCLSRWCWSQSGQLRDTIKPWQGVAPQPSADRLFPSTPLSLVSPESVGACGQGRRGTRGAGGDGGGAGLRPVPRGGDGSVRLSTPALRPRRGQAAQRGGAALRVQPRQLREDAQGSHLRHDHLWLRLRYVGAARRPALGAAAALRSRPSEQTFLMLKPKASAAPCSWGVGGGVSPGAPAPVASFMAREPSCPWAWPQLTALTGLCLLIFCQITKVGCSV